MPGDNAEFATLEMNKEFFEFGDRAATRLVGLRDQGAFVITGRITYYNETSQQAEANFFTPEVCGYRGWCPSGLAANQNILVYSAEISAANPLGAYAIDFCLYDSNGVLRQQIFRYFYVGRTANWGRMVMYIDRVTVFGDTVELIGQFPENTDLVVWAGNLTEGFYSTSPGIRAKGGRVIKMTQPFGFGQGEHPVDIVVFCPEWRTSTGMPRAYVAKAASPQSSTNMQ